MSLRPIRVTERDQYGQETAVETTLAYVHAHLGAVWRVVAPFAVVEEVCRTGQHRGQTSIEFEPFQLTREEYESLVRFMEANAGMRSVEAPDWVRTPDDYRIWAQWVDWGVPVEENRSRLAQLEEVAARLRAAHDRGDEAEAARISVEEYDPLSQGYADWRSPFVERARAARPNEKWTAIDQSGAVRRWGSHEGGRGATAGSHASRWSVGAEVSHPRFGRGCVAAILSAVDPVKVRVNFEDGTSRDLLADRLDVTDPTGT